MIEAYWNYILIYLDIAVPLASLIAVLVMYSLKKATLVTTDYVLLIFFMLQVVLNSMSNFLQDHRINNHWLYHTNALVTQLLFTSYFYLLFPTQRLKLFTVSGFIAFVIFFVVNILLLQPLDTFPSYSYALGSLLLVVYGLLTFQNWFEEVPATNILSLKEFWAISGILLYFGSGFFIFITYHYLSIVSSKDVGILWKFHNIFLALGCLVFLRAFTCKKWIQRSYL